MATLAGIEKMEAKTLNTVTIGLLRLMTAGAFELFDSVPAMLPEQ
ncbi:MAG: hypothetical protein ACQESR_31165 [Planctomycetota bacterium]